MFSLRLGFVKYGLCLLLHIQKNDKNMIYASYASFISLMSSYS
jgi:hypothetical protein